jgi:hypothetical protein
MNRSLQLKSKIRSFLGYPQKGGEQPAISDGNPYLLSK